MLLNKISLYQGMSLVLLLIRNGPEEVHLEFQSHQSEVIIDVRLIPEPLDACDAPLMRRMKVCVDLPIRHQRQPEERPVLLDARDSLFGNFL
jgi:hypothetical protein